MAIDPFHCVLFQNSMRRTKTGTSSERIRISGRITQEGGAENQVGEGGAGNMVGEGGAGLEWEGLGWREGAGLEMEGLRTG